MSPNSNPINTFCVEWNIEHKVMGGERQREVGDIMLNIILSGFRLQDTRFCSVKFVKIVRFEIDN